MQEKDKAVSLQLKSDNLAEEAKRLIREAIERYRANKD